MRHKEIEELIQKKLDREITRDEESILFKHVKECPECRSYYLEMERIKESLTGLIEFFPGLDFKVRVLARIRIRKRNFLPKFMPVFAGIYFVSLIILLFSPLLNYLGKKFLVSLPNVLRVFGILRSAGDGIMLLISSLLRLGLPQFSFWFLFCLFAFCLFIKIMEKFKEERWVISKSY